MNYQEIIRKNRKLLYFIFVGTSGILINLVITGLANKYLFQGELFYLASILGTTINIIYNFSLHTSLTFQTKTKHKRRLAYFTTYTIFLATLQELIIRVVIPIIGVSLLLPFKAFVVLFFSAVTFLFFNFILFNERNSENKI